MAHDFGQMLANPSGNIMHAFIVNGLNQLRQMTGFNLSDIHRADNGENVAFKASENFTGVGFRPEFKTAGVPRHCRMPECAGFINGGVVRLVKLRRADAGCKQLTCCIALFAGFRQRDLRIGAKGQTAFFPGEAVAEIP